MNEQTKRVAQGTQSGEEFEKMAKEDAYIDEAFEMLKHMSADEKKRLEYEAREKAIRDYNSQMQGMREEGFSAGEKRKAAKIIRHMLEKGKSPEEIADMTGESLETIFEVSRSDE